MQSLSITSLYNILSYLLRESFSKEKRGYRFKHSKKRWWKNHQFHHFKPILHISCLPTFQTNFSLQNRLKRAKLQIITANHLIPNNHKSIILQLSTGVLKTLQNLPCPLENHIARLASYILRKLLFLTICQTLPVYVLYYYLVNLPGKLQFSLQTFICFVYSASGPVITKENLPWFELLLTCVVFVFQ